MKLGIIGAGAWGLALYKGLKACNEACIASATSKPGFTPLLDVLDNDFLLFVISTQHTKAWLKANITPNSKQKILVASKGIITPECEFLDDVYEKYFPKENICFLSGPSFAAEFAKGLPCALVLSSTNEALAASFASTFDKNYVKTYTSFDVKGAQIAGAYKNILAIASGICDALGFGQNARASLMARGLVEMQRFGEHYGAKTRTFLGLCGAGDLFLSASSILSRNYRTGLGLGRGESLESILASLGEVAEGVATAKAVVKMAKTSSIYTPIACEIDAILKGKDVRQSVRDLLS